MACRARPSHGAKATLPTRWQHAHMWAPPEAGRRARGTRRYGLGRVSPACAAGELCGATGLQHQRLTLQGTWDLDKLEDQVQQVLTEEESLSASQCAGVSRTLSCSSCILSGSPGTLPQSTAGRTAHVDLPTVDVAPMERHPWYLSDVKPGQACQCVLGSGIDCAASIKQRRPRQR